MATSQSPPHVRMYRAVDMSSKYVSVLVILLQKSSSALSVLLFKFFLFSNVIFLSDHRRICVWTCSVRNQMDIVPQTMNQLQTGQSVSLTRYKKSSYSLLPQSFGEMEKLQCILPCSCVIVCFHCCLGPCLYFTSFQLSFNLQPYPAYLIRLPVVKPDTTRTFWIP